MADGTIKIGVEIDGKDFKSELSEIESISEKTGNSISNNFKKSFSKTANIVSASIGGIAIAATKIGKDFEAQMSKVEAISGATADEMDKLRKKAEEMGRSTKFSAKQSAEALEYMALAGFKTEDMLDSLDGVINLAAASGEDLGLVSDILTDGLTAFGLSAKESGRFADVLAAAASNSNTNIAMLGESFKYVAPVAGALSFSIEDTATALGLMANSGIKASQAGTSLRSILTNLTSEAAPIVGTLIELGVVTTDTAGNMLPLNNILNQLRESFSNLTEVQKAQYAKTLAGQEGMSGLLAIVNSAEADFNKLSNAINGSTGTAEEMARVMQDNLQGKLTTLKSQLEGLAINIYNYLEEPLKKAADVASKSLKVLSDNIHIVVPVIGTLTAAFLAYKAALGIQSLIGGVSNSLKMLKSVTTLMTVAQGALNAVMNANPYILVTTLILGLVTALVALWKKNEGFRDAIKNIWAEIKETISNVVDAIISFFTEKIPEAFNTLMNMFKELPSKMIDIGKDIVKGLWNGIKSMGTWIKDKIVGFGQTIVDSVKGFFGINSPSKLFEKEIGVMLAKGIIVGAEAQEDDVVKSLTEPFKIAKSEIKDIYSPDLLNDLMASLPRLEESIRSTFANMTPRGTYSSVVNRTVNNNTNNQGDIVLKIENFNANDKMDINTILTEASFYQKQRYNSIGVVK